MWGTQEQLTTQALCVNLDSAPVSMVDFGPARRCACVPLSVLFKCLFVAQDCTAPPKGFRIPPHSWEECVFLEDGLHEPSQLPCDPP